MKKAKLFFALSAICGSLQSQPLTGIDTYLHSATGRLSDGTTTSYNSTGFIMAGYQPFSGAATDNIFIDKTDNAGQISSSPEFSNAYEFMAGSGGCFTPLANVTTCYGITLAELQYTPVSTQWYVMAAAFDRGCLFSGLDMNGNPMAPVFYSFPLGTINQSKPLILSSTLNPGRFFICGSYTLNGKNHVYVMHININGVFAWNNDYVCPNNAVIIPTAIVESPYTPASNSELVIVGSYDDGSAMLREGFFTRLGVATGGNVIAFQTYGSGGSSMERFLSIAVASSPMAGPPGYIIGGSSTFNPAQGTSMMMKTDMNGGPNWSRVIFAATGTNGEVTGVRERFSTLYGRYEYYGAATENNGMTVFKLDEMGNVFSQPFNMNNEFIYNDNLGGSATPEAITFIDNSLSPNNGIHVYGTNTTGNGDFFMTRDCFNGASGNTFCTPSNITLNVMPPPFSSAMPVNMNPNSLNIGSGLRPCSDFNFYVSATSVATILNPCDNSVMPAGGNQNKTAVATGIRSNTANEFSISPNPVTDKLTISYGSNAGTNVWVSLYNNLGQLVIPETVQPHNSTMLELDLGKLNINSGVYFVTITVDGVKTSKKIIYTK